jgi:hypothetical protein
MAGELLFLLPLRMGAGLALEVQRANAWDAAEWIRLARAGDFARAWGVSDRIRARTSPGADPDVPRHQQLIWDATPLDGRRVLVRCYHGLGDTIQFARYLPRLCAIAREVIVWAQPELLPLLRTLHDGFGDCRCHRNLTLLPLHNGTPDVDFDVDIEIMELAYAFRTTLMTIPADVPYLRVSPARAALTLPRLPAEPETTRRIGLVWRAGEWDPRRSIDFDQLEPLLAGAGERGDASTDSGPAVRWYGLQLDARPHEQHANLHHLVPRSVLDTAAFVESMDLVITIDSMPAHLAGALGRAVWTLLPCSADWRWLEQRVDSPWYPSMRLFRQHTPGDWSHVIDDVRRALAS